MAYTMMTCLPCDVVTKIVDRGAELKLKERLKQGWGLIHDEMMWRDTHEYSCPHHCCVTDSCNCYRRYPGFLLRRVDSGVWLSGHGETRQMQVWREGSWADELYDDLESQPNGALWFDFETNEAGHLRSLIPTLNFTNDIEYL